jgi:serine/threonine protein kinase
MIGQTLNNRYKVMARLGKGAMGTVYRATDTQNGQEVALKVISSELAIEPEMLERFKREGEALRKLKHPNIVGFLDAFQHGEQYVIAMEYVSGGSLHELIKSSRLPIERARQITLDLCDALIRAHRLSIIHRDIKPENILIDEDGTPKLADFGIAKLSEGTRMTRSGTQVGTPYYMAPEAWTGEVLDGQADIWSLGVLLFEMLAGEVPFGGDTPMVVMSKINTTPPPDLKKLRADVPPRLVKIVIRMLTRDKKRRYQTMREVGVDLESGQQMTTPAPVSLIANPTYANFRILGVGAIVLLVLIFGALGLNTLLQNLLVTKVAVPSTPTLKPISSPTKTLSPAATPTPIPLIFSVSELKLDSEDWPMGSHDASGTNFNPSENKLYPPLNIKWTKTISDYSIDSLTVSKGMVALAGMGTSDKNQVYMLNAETGEILWNFILTAGGGGVMDNAVLFGEDKVFFGGQGDTNLYALSVNTGNVVWTYPNISGLYASRLAVINNKLYVPDEENGMALLNTDGNSVWGELKGSWGQSVAISNDLVIGVYSDRKSLIARNVETGIKKWQYDELTAYFTQIATDDEKVFVNISETEIVALNLQTGDVDWKKIMDVQDLGGGGEFALTDNVICVTIWKDKNGKGGISCLDTNTGEILWSFSTNAEGVLEIAIANDVVYLSAWGDYTLYALDLHDGHRLWSFSLPCSGGDIAIAKGALYIQACNSIYALEN